MTDKSPKTRSSKPSFWSSCARHRNAAAPYTSRSFHSMTTAWRAAWEVASCNAGTSAPAACERALYDIVRRLQEDFEYRADLGRPSDGNDDATGEQDHNHAIRAGGIRPGAGHAAQAGGRRPISPSGGSANESLVCDL